MRQSQGEFHHRQKHRREIFPVCGAKSPAVPQTQEGIARPNLQKQELTRSAG